MTVLPGFIDSHCHPSGVDELFGVNANVRTVPSCRRRCEEGRIDAARLLGDRLHVRRHQARPAAHAPGSRRVSTLHPIVVNHRGGHTSWYNRKALRAGGRHARRRPIRRTAVSSATPAASSPAGSPSRRAASSTASARREQFTPSSSAIAHRQGMRYISELLDRGRPDHGARRRRQRDQIRAYEDVHAPTASCAIAPT